jgi:DNA-binding CsgD family transcriptional regulator
MGGWSSSVERNVTRSIARVCSTGTDSVSLRQEVLRHVRKVVPAEACFFNTLDPETGLITHGLGEDAPPQLMRQFFSVVYPEGEAERIVDLARSGEIVAHNASEELRQLFASVGFGRELRAAFSVRGEPWGLWCAVRERRSRPFDERERIFLRRIAPAVARALQTAALREAASVASGDADEVAPGILVVDERGAVLQRTPAAAAQLLDLADIGRSTTELPSVLEHIVARGYRSAEAGWKLAELPSVICGVLARLRLARGSEVAWRHALRARGQSGRWYTIRGALTEPDGSRSNAIVLIAPVSRAEVAPLLARLYGLSPREREVLALVARGCSTKEIAGQLGISSYTVQEHLSHASDKVGVRGRRALLARLFFDGYAHRLHQ